jgi:pimeloyl-ACP methyl ester carboxylesterase
LELQFPRAPAPDFSAAPGLHEGLMFGGTEVLYYIPRRLDLAKAEYVFLIHGAGDWHRPGASTHIAVWRELADRENLVLVAPVFDCIHNRTIDPTADLDEFGRFRDGKIIRDRYLWDFVFLLNRHTVHRADLKLIEVFDFFRKELIPRSKFILYGHSGGGQFVSRFAMLYPELLKRAACSSAGTYAFPDLDRDYPWGLNMDRLEMTFGTHIKADDLRIDPKQRGEKLSRFLALELHVIVGSEETGDDHPDSAWQGRNVHERAGNFVKALRRARDSTGSATSGERLRLGARLHVMEGVGHDALKSGETAKRLLFPGHTD